MLTLSQLLVFPFSSASSLPVPAEPLGVGSGNSLNQDLPSAGFLKPLPPGPFPTCSSSVSSTYPLPSPWGPKKHYSEQHRDPAYLHKGLDTVFPASGPHHLPGRKRWLLTCLMPKSQGS